LGGLVLGDLLALPCGVTPARAQADNDVLYRIERLENQLRQMTGEIEQLQYRNQQLEAALGELRGGRAPAPVPGAGGAMAAPPVQPGQPMQSPPAYSGGRHGDAFDPSQNPGAPGAPRQLGTLPLQQPPPNTRPGMGPTPYAGGGGPDQGYGRPPAGAPPQQTAYPVAPAYPQGTPQEAPPGTQQGSPSESSQEAYEAGVAHLKRRDYAAAEDAFRDFVTRFPTDRMTADAQYNLGEALFQRQNYREAADAFVQLSKRFESSTRAPDGLLRLGQSLAAMNETELACVAFADIGRKYPRARPELRQAVEREQKRARCSPA